MLVEVTVKQSCMHSIIYSTGREFQVLSTCSVVLGKEVCFLTHIGRTEFICLLSKINNYRLVALDVFVFTIAFRLLPFPLEQGHHHEPYPASTTNLDKEILPGTNFYVSNVSVFI